MQHLRMGLVYTTKSTFAIKVLLVLAILFGANILLSDSASASMATNSRLHYGNAWSFCTTPDNNSGGNYYAKGMVWLANDEGDYYSETVSVGTNANSVRVSIRGAVNACQTSWPGNRNMYAIDVSTSWLSGLSGNQFYRGWMPAGGNFAWTTQGTKLYGDLDVSRAARCSAAHYSTGVARETIYVDIARRQEQRNDSWQITYQSPTVGVETVPINVVRTCPMYNYSLTPTMTSPTNGDVLEDPRPVLTVTGSVRNNGPTDSKPNINWRITKIRYAPGVTIARQFGGARQTGPSSPSPCNGILTGYQACDPVNANDQSVYPRNNVVGHAGNTSTDDYAVGTQICFAMSVRQFNQSTENWLHSDLACYVIGKKPKVNILGGDLFVGRSLAGITAPISARVVTGNSVNSSGTFGSWSEYAIASSGPVTNMSSGSGYVGGNAANTNLLTFVNTGNTAATCATTNGCYAHGTSIPDVAARFRTASSNGIVGTGSLSARPSGLYRTTGNIDISTSAIGKGRSIIINSSANVTISGNITYDNGPFASASELPQLVIIANNITINAGVERVDAWLIAPGTRAGTSVTGGVIRTCNLATTAINSRTCERPLVINGPVIANRLLMLRTGGSEPGNRRGEPAEVFNFRPDAYIWALQQAQVGGRVTTVSTKELPPRF